MLAARELGGGAPHLLPDVGPRHEQLERGGEGVDLVRVDRHAERSVAGKLGEPADVADDERLSERERADRDPRGLAHGRVAQVHRDVRARHERPEPALVDPVLAAEAVVREAEPLKAAIEVETGRRRPGEEQRRVRMTVADGGERAEELGDPLARVHDSEAADDRPRRHALGLEVRHRPGGVRDVPDPALVAGRAHEVAHGLRVDDHARRVLEHEAGEREVLGPRLPERRDPLVEDAVREQAADDTVLELHRVEVAVAVAPADGHPGDEVVDDEVVQDDDARPAAQRVDDPARARPGCSRRGRAATSVPRGARRRCLVGTTVRSSRFSSAGSRSAL